MKLIKLTTIDSHSNTKKWISLYDTNIVFIEQDETEKYTRVWLADRCTRDIRESYWVVETIDEIHALIYGTEPSNIPKLSTDRVLPQRGSCVMVRNDYNEPWKKTIFHEKSQWGIRTYDDGSGLYSTVWNQWRHCNEHDK